MTRKQRKSRAALKKAGLILGISLVILIIAVLAIEALLNPIVDRICRAQTSPFFGERLQIGSIGVALWQGALVIKDVELAQPPGFGPGSMLRAETIKLRVALLPLLRKELLLYGITVVEPEINLVQVNDGRMNSSYYFAKLQQRPAATSAGTSLRFHLKSFRVRHAEFTLTNPKLSYRRPAFRLTGCDLRLKNLNLPNPDRAVSPFWFRGWVASAHPAWLQIDGSGVFGAGPLSFEAHSRLKDLELAEFSYLFPDAAVTVQSGRAWVNSTAQCTNNYLDSTQEVHTTNLRVSSSKAGLLGRAFMGVPAAIFVRFIQDKNGTLDFEFKVSGNLNQLKADWKGTIGRAVAQSLRAKMGSVWPITKEIIKEGAQKTGAQIKKGFNKIFH